MASSQDIVDFMPPPLAMAGRMARPHRPLHLQTRGFLAALDRADKPPRLTRQILKGGFHRCEPVQDVC